MQIQAAVLRDAGGPYSIEPIELAAPGPDELLVRIVGVGMCHTDVLPRAEVSLSPPPIICGHEGAGVVEAIGSAVRDIEVGDHVVLSFDSCGACANCRAGASAYCDTFLLRNLLGRRVDGTTGATDASGAEVASRWFGQSSFATHCLATARNAVVVDRSLPLEKLGPLGCGVQTGAGSVLVALGVTEGQSLAVFGAGAVGLSAVMAGRVVGADPIIAVDLHPERLALARELGATHVFDGADPGIVGGIHEITGGGAHHALDATGVPGVILSALSSLRMTGTCGLIGVQQGDLVLDPLALVGKTVIGILEGSAEPRELIPRMIELWQEGRFPFDRLIEEFPLAAIDDAEAASLSGRVVKPVLRP